MSTKVIENKPAFQGQREGEVVELVFRQHPLVMRKELVIGLFIIVLGVVPLDFPQVYEYAGAADILTKVALVLPILVFAFWFRRWVSWYYTVYIVTNQRIIEVHQKGFFDRSITEWQHNKILHVNYRVGGFQAVIFNYGDITVRTVIGDLLIPTIHRPVKIHAQLQAIILRGGGEAAADQGSDASTPYYN
jgi:hypothetical protein